MELLKGTRVGLLEELQTGNAHGAVGADQGSFVTSKGPGDRAEEYCKQL